jgi:putative addiction module component (TIGR02574 family)
MSFAEVLEELPKLTPEEREAVIQRALELDETPFTPEEEALIEKRMAEHRANPDSAIPADEMFARLRAKFSK